MYSESLVWFHKTVHLVLWYVLLLGNQNLARNAAQNENKLKFLSTKNKTNTEENWQIVDYEYKKEIPVEEMDELDYQNITFYDYVKESERILKCLIRFS